MSLNPFILTAVSVGILLPAVLLAQSDTASVEAAYQKPSVSFSEVPTMPT